MTRGRPKHDDILTPREWQVLDLLREGLTNEQIASRLGVSESGARYHVSEILSKLGVGSREQAAAWGASASQRRPLLGIGLALAARKLTIVKAGLATAAVAGVAGLTVLFVLSLENASRIDDSAGPLGKIAYVQDGDVWVKALPDGKPQRLTKEGSYSSPRWSPSGGWLLVLRTIPPPGGGGRPDFQTWVIRADGSGRRRPDAASPGGAGWSPVADQLLYYDPTGATVIEDADGSHRRQVIGPRPTAAGERISCTYLSPDAKWFACVEERWSVGPGAGTQTPGPSQTPSAMNPPDQNRTYVGLIRVAADTGDPHEVYSLGPNPGERISPIGWSADSTKILFSVREAQATSREGLFRLRLYLVAAEGGPALDLGLTSSFFAPLAGSPDGQRFAITAGRLIESWTDKSIAVVDLQTGRVTTLTGPAMAAVAPAWSPDGSSIAFVASGDHGVLPPDAPVDVRRAAEDAGLASRRLWVMAADGSGQRQLTSDAELRDESPEWSKDGAHILFARLPTEPCARQYSLWLLDVRDGRLDEVAAGLPLFGTYEALQVGDIPRCATNYEGGITDSYGFVSLNQVLDWWQAPIAPP
jgi:DNA-binding CsgD family transcriptional regulator/WD40 repeat protein